MFVNPHHAHPLSINARGNSYTPLDTQAAMLLLLLNRVSHAAIHRLIHGNHKAIENMDTRLCQLREAWVLDEEKKICFGQGQKWRLTKPPLIGR